MKWAFHTFWVSFAISTVFVAPFLQQKKDSTATSTAPIPVNVTVTNITVSQTQAGSFVPSNNVPVLNELIQERAKADQEKAAEAKAEQDAKEAAFRSYWKESLPFYRGILTNFYDLLNKEAKKQRDTLTPSSSYELCLTPDIYVNEGISNVARLVFQKNTNWNFQIVVLSAATLRIQCSGGYLNLDPLRPDASHVATSLYGPNGSLLDNPVGLIGDSSAIFQKSMTNLIQLQENYLNSTNFTLKIK